MRRKVSVFIIIAICFLLQTTLFQALSFASISPNPVSYTHLTLPTKLEV